MTLPSPPMTADVWFRHLFSSKAAVDGGIVRRKIRDMEKMVGRERFYAEISRRGFSAVENAGQVVVFCNASSFHVLNGRVQTLEKSLGPNPQ